MLFHSNQYLLIFLPTLFFLYYFKYKNFYFPKIITLSFASVIFYSAWNIYFLPLIIFIILCNYFCHKLLLRNKRYLFLLISLNLLILIIFKYTDFIILNINLLFKSDIEFINLPFPLALSFVTFQIIAFLVDYYDRGIKKIEFNYFFLFIIFFPQLIAGPIVKYNDVIFQYKNKKNKNINIKNVFVGLILIFYGTQSRWHGFVGWGARYLLIATPLLLLPLGATLEKRNGPSLKVILVVLVSFGLFINVIYVSQDVVWFIWGDAFTGRNGLYLVDKIDGIRDDLNLDRATMWSLKYSQITHSMTYFFSLLQPDIFMLKVLGNSFYALTVTVLTSIPAYFLLKLTKSVAINHNRNE